MPQRLVFGLAATGFVGWSLLLLFAWLVVNLGGDVLRLLAPVLFFGHPEAPSIVDTGARLLVAAGGWVVTAVWLTGCALLALVSLLFHRLTGGQIGMARFDYHYTRHESRGREMHDVTPPSAKPPGPRHQQHRPIIDQE
jgi:hypothetical protein